MKDAAAPGPPLEPPGAAATAPYGVTSARYGEVEPASLPRDHPAWQRDVLSVSARVRAALAALRPVAVRVLSFWDHAVRNVAVGRRRLEVDPSGCYRMR